MHLKEKLEADKLYTALRHRVSNNRRKEEIEELTKKVDHLTYEVQKLEKENKENS